MDGSTWVWTSKALGTSPLKSNPKAYRFFSKGWSSSMSLSALCLNRSITSFGRFWSRSSADSSSEVCNEAILLRNDDLPTDTIERCLRSALWRSDITCNVLSFCLLCASRAQEVAATVRNIVRIQINLTLSLVILIVDDHQRRRLEVKLEVISKLIRCVGVSVCSCSLSTYGRTVFVFKLFELLNFYEYIYVVCDHFLFTGYFRRLRDHPGSDTYSWDIYVCIIFQQREFNCKI